VFANFAAASVSVLLGAEDGSYRDGGSYGTGAGPVAVAVGDFTGDGWPDLAVATSVSNNVSILLNDGNWPGGPGPRPGPGERRHALTPVPLTGDLGRALLPTLPTATGLAVSKTAPPDAAARPAPPAGALALALARPAVLAADHAPARGSGALAPAWGEALPAGLLEDAFADTAAPWFWPALGSELGIPGAW
jgi:hypothetical protein